MHSENILIIKPQYVLDQYFNIGCDRVSIFNILKHQTAAFIIVDFQSSTFTFELHVVLPFTHIRKKG